MKSFFGSRWNSAILTTAVAVVAALAAPRLSWAQVIAPEFAGTYSLVNLGTPTDVPGSLGGLTLQSANSLLIGGNANSTSAAIYQIGVTRTLINGQNRITGFSGSATQFATAPGIGSGGIDGGLAFAPNGTLLYTSFADNSLGQIAPGDTTPTDQIALSDFGITSSVGTLAFVPAGSPGAGRLKIASFSGSTWYDVVLSAPLPNGTFDIVSATLTATLGGGGPEGIIYVPGGSPLFTNPSVLISEYSAGRVSAYEVNSNGDPLVDTRRDFITGLTGAEGGFLDSTSNDFLFSTFGSGNSVIRVSGFAAPAAAAAPEPGTLALLTALGLPMVGIVARRRRS